MAERGENGFVVLCLRSGQTVRLPLRKVGRGVEKPPVGPVELDRWLEKRHDVLAFEDITFAYVEPAVPDAG